MKIHHQNLNSSVLSSVAWDPQFDILYVKFLSGSCWVYHQVDFETSYDLIHANSCGNFFNKNIRNNTQICGHQVSVKQQELHHV